MEEIQNKKQNKLVGELESLLTLARRQAFYEGKSKEFIAPNMELSNRFRVLRRDTLAGKFNNIN